MVARTKQLIADLWGAISVILYALQFAKLFIFQEVTLPTPPASVVHTFLNVLVLRIKFDFDNSKPNNLA